MPSIVGYITHYEKEIIDMRYKLAYAIAYVGWQIQRVAEYISPDGAMTVRIGKMTQAIDREIDRDEADRVRS